MFSPRVRDLSLTLHVASVGWFGSVAVFLVLAIAGLMSAGSAAKVRRGRDGPRSDMVIVPLCFAALVTGVVQSLGTKWGLVRHYWVPIKRGPHATSRNS